MDDFKRFKSFIDDNNNFKLEDRLRDFIHMSTLGIIDLKIIINALQTQSFDSVYAFMKEEDLLRHFAYLTNADYVRLDYSYSDVSPFQISHNVQIHAHSITEFGHRFFEKRNIFRVKESEYMLSEFVKDLKVGVKQNDYMSYFNSNCYLKDFIVFDFS